MTEQELKGLAIVAATCVAILGLAVANRMTHTIVQGKLNAANK